MPLSKYVTHDKSKMISFVTTPSADPESSEFCTQKERSITNG